MKKLMLALMSLALLGTGVSFADNAPAAGSTPAATSSAKKPAVKKHVKKAKKAKKSKDAAKPAAEQPK